jgi:hypothetical protein
MKYTGFDKVAPAKLAGTEKFVDLCSRRWGFKNLGTLNVRLMRSAPAGTKPDDPKWMSVHATGRAADISYGTDKAKAIEAMNWFVAHAEALGIEEVHDYSGLTKKGCEQWGRGWRCDRHGKPDWKDWTATDNGGTPKATWIHIELSPDFASDAVKLETAWRALPKP